MASGRPVFRVPVLVWVDTPDVDRHDAESGAWMALGFHLCGLADAEALALHLRSGDRPVRVVEVESLREALSAFHLTLDAGQRWAERAGEKADD